MLSRGRKIITAPHKDLQSRTHRPTDEPWSRTLKLRQSDLLYGSKSLDEKVGVTLHFQASWASQAMGCLLWTDRRSGSTSVGVLCHLLATRVHRNTSDHMWPKYFSWQELTSLDLSCLCSTLRARSQFDSCWTKPLPIWLRFESSLSLMNLNHNCLHFVLNTPSPPHTHTLLDESGPQPNEVVEARA